MALEQLLDKIVAHLERLNRPAARLLQPGLTSDGFHKQVKHLPITLPVSLVRMYLWRNGTMLTSGATLDQLSFCPGYYFMSLTEAIVSYQTCTKAIPGSDWETSWFPFLHNGSGDFFAIDSRDASIVHYLGQDIEPLERYASLQSMLTIWDAYYSEGAFYVDEGGYLRVNYKVADAIAATYNPSID